MRAYFLGNPAAVPALQQRYQKILAALTAANVTVWSNLRPDSVDEQDSPPLERVDSVIIEGSDPTPEAGHLVALALAYRKPVLYLSERGKPVNRHLRRLQENKTTGAYLRLESYAAETLSARLREFLRQVEQGEERVTPNIKFTLRLTPAIEHYLNRKAKAAAKTKANYLRNFLERLMAGDEEYRKKTNGG